MAGIRGARLAMGWPKGMPGVGLVAGPGAEVVAGPATDAAEGVWALSKDAPAKRAEAASRRNVRVRSGFVTAGDPFQVSGDVPMITRAGCVR